MTVRPTYTVALAVAALMGGAHFANSCAAEPGDAVTHSSKALLALGGRFQAVQDSLLTLEDRTDSLLALSQAKEGTALHAVGQDSTAVAQSATARDSLSRMIQEVTDLRAAVSTCEHSGSLLRQAGAYCSERSDSLQHRVTALTLQLTAQVNVQPPRCAWGVGAGVSAASPHVDVMAGRFCRL